MRRSFTIVSIAVHSVVIAAALLAQVVADGALPAPHQPILFDSSQFMPVDIQLPRPRSAPAASTSDAASPDVAPIVAPTGVQIEPDRDREVAVTPGGMISGIENGPPSSIEAVGGSGIAPPPAPAPIAPIHLHSGMKPPTKTTDVAPIYPAIAKSAHVQGVVILEAVLDAQGRVTSVHILRSIPLLDDAAVVAVQQWRFTPALLNGEPVPVVMTVTVNFALQ
jgi:periplasmic protein TonB